MAGSSERAAEVTVDHEAAVYAEGQEELENLDEAIAATKAAQLALRQDAEKDRRWDSVQRRMHAYPRALLVLLIASAAVAALELVLSWLAYHGVIIHGPLEAAWYLWPVDSFGQDMTKLALVLLVCLVIAALAWRSRSRLVRSAISKGLEEL